MSDQTPDRLKEFRNQYGGRNDGRSNWWNFVQTAIFIAGFGAILAVLLQGGRPTPYPRDGGGGLSTDDQRRYAGYLAEKDELVAAVAAYESYLDQAALTPDERAKVCYRVASLAMNAGMDEKALAFLYQAEMLAPDSDLRADIDGKIIRILEKQGRASELREALRDRSGVTKPGVDVEEDEVVLAEVGEAVITNTDLDRAIQELPPAAQESMKDAERRRELLKNLVAERVLVDKARRLELDKDPALQARLAEQLETSMVRKLIDDEVESKLNVTPQDVERFYEAEQELFTVPAQASVRYATAPSREAAADATEFAKGPVTIREGGNVPGLQDSAAAVDAILSAEPGARVGPFQAGDQWIVFKVERVQPGHVRPFETVRDQAERMYRSRKEQELVQAMMEETLQTQNVELYLDRIPEQDE